MNSPYVMIRGGDKKEPSMELVREGLTVEEGFQHNRSIDMSRATARKSFVSHMGTTTNDNRFALNDWFDKSSYLTKVKRPKGIVSFRATSQREPDLIQKGGNRLIKIDRKPEKFYDAPIPNRGKRIDTQITKMHKQTNRKQNFSSMYKLDEDLTPDYYDSVKIATDQIKVKRNEKPFVDMKKQTKRDLS